MFINRGMNKEDMIYFLWNINHKKELNTIMPFETSWMDLKIIIVSKVRERQIPYDISYM